MVEGFVEMVKSGLASFYFTDTAFRLTDETFSGLTSHVPHVPPQCVGVLLIGAIYFIVIVQVRVLVSASLCRRQEEPKSAV